MGVCVLEGEERMRVGGVWGEGRRVGGGGGRRGGRGGEGRKREEWSHMQSHINTLRALTHPRSLGTGRKTTHTFTRAKGRADVGQ